MGGLKCKKLYNKFQIIRLRVLIIFNYWLQKGMVA